MPDGLPATPSFKLVAFLWANTLLLAPVALAGAAMGANVLGPNWAWSAKAARQGVLFALPWIALSFAPLDKWVPAMADVTAHTELLTATALGVEFGGYRRWGQVAGATALVSASAGALEEAAFRGVAQRGVAAAVAWLLRLGRAATAGPVDRVATRARARPRSSRDLARASPCRRASRDVAPTRRPARRTGGKHPVFMYVNTCSSDVYKPRRDPSRGRSRGRSSIIIRPRRSY